MLHRYFARRTLSAMMLFAPSMLVVPGCVAQTDAAIAITNVTVIPMDRERVLRAQTVVIEHGRIASVRISSSAKIPSGAKRIDGAGRFLIPGLVDAHVHYDDDTPAKHPHVDEITAPRPRARLRTGGGRVRCREIPPRATHRSSTRPST